MKSVRTAVIGVGHMGRWHANKFAALKTSNLVAIVDADIERCRSIGQELDVDAIEDYRELPGKVDAVTVATPTKSHHEIVGYLLRNGIHVLVEKPITATVAEAESLIVLADAEDLVLQVGHLQRFNPALMAVTPYVNNPRFIESHRIAPYTGRSVDISVVLDLMIHDIDLIHGLVRSPVAKIDATGESIISNSIDIANARITFASGCVANITSSRISFKTQQTLRIFQSDAYFSMDLGKNTSTVYRKKRSGPVQKLDDIEIDSWSGDSGDPLLVQNKAFLEAVAGGAPPIVDGRIAMDALQTATTIVELINNK